MPGDKVQEALDELRHYAPDEPGYLARISLALVYAVQELTAEVRAGRQAREPELIELVHESPDRSGILADAHTEFGEPLPGTPGEPEVHDDLHRTGRHELEAEAEEDARLDPAGHQIIHPGLTGLAVDIADVTGTDYGTAAWLAGRVFQTLVQMRRESLRQDADQPGDPVEDEDDPSAWAILYDREGEEPGDGADYDLTVHDTIREAHDPDS